MRSVDNMASIHSLWKVYKKNLTLSSGDYFDLVYGFKCEVVSVLRCLAMSGDDPDSLSASLVSMFP